MSDAFIAVVEEVIGIEGGYTDDPADSGGKTRFGITEATAREWGYTGPMSELPPETARQIYRDLFWYPLNLDVVAMLSRPIARELFEAGVLCGIGRAGTFLQRALNVFNRQQKDYPDLKPDGAVGPVTLDALAAYLKVRGGVGELVMLRNLNAQQGCFLNDLAERREKDERFIFGWYKNRVVI